MAKKQHRTKSSGAAKVNLAGRAFGPAADAFGKELVPLGREAGTLTAKIGGHLLSSLNGVVYGVDHVAVWLRDAVTRRLEKTSQDKIVKPDARIVIPLTQALVYSMEEERIREMFANLLAANMHADTKAQT